MKVFIILSALVVAVSAGGYGNSYASNNGGNSYGMAAETGSSSQFRHDDSYGNYNFGYDEAHTSGSTSRREEEKNGVRRGSYSLYEADGRRRTVNYVADAHGFRATVETNEPGTESKSPADVIMNGAQPASTGYGAQAAQTSYSAPAATGYTQMAAPRYQAAQTYSAPAVQAYSAPARAMSYGYSAPRQQQYTTSYSAPMRSASYSAPAQSYSASSYSAPAQSYSASSYSAPTQSYSAPSYSAPASSYSAPQQYEAQTPKAFNYSFSSHHPASYGKSSYGNAGSSYGSSYATAAPAQASYSTYQAPATYQQQSPIRSSGY